MTELFTSGESLESQWRLCCGTAPFRVQIRPSCSRCVGWDSLFSFCLSESTVSTCGPLRAPRYARSHASAAAAVPQTRESWPGLPGPRRLRGHHFIGDTRGRLRVTSSARQVAQRDGKIYVRESRSFPREAPRLVTCEVA